MRILLKRAVVAATIAATLVTGVVYAAYTTPLPPTGNSGVVAGIGATFPAPLYTKWFGYFKTKYAIANASASCATTSRCASFTYAANGSGAGRTAVRGATMTADFGASDVVMGSSDLTTASNNGRTIIHVPLTLGGVALGYRLDGVKTALRLTKNIVNKIYAGEITMWNDAAIRAVNSGVTIPATAILPFHRSDSSGTQQVFLTYLKAAPTQAPWSGCTPGGTWPTTCSSVSVFAGYAANGSSGVASSVKNTNGAIGIMELSYIAQYGLRAAALQNPAGSYITPTTSSFTAAAATATPYADTTYGLRYDPIVQASGSGSYPIVSYSFALLSDDVTDTPGYRAYGVKNAETQLAFLFWALQSTGGQSYATANGYAPLPSTVAASAVNQLKRISCPSCTGHTAGYLWNP